jgi:hypothetical protein
MTEDERGVLISRMKGMPRGGDGIRLPIRDEKLSIIGYLRAFDAKMLDDRELIETMAEARTKYKDFFLTQFVTTYENKRNWLENSVLKNEKKVLFLVETADGLVVGQDGFTFLEGDVFAADATMRWRQGGDAKLFYMDTVERAGLCFGFLKGSLCVAEVFKDNVTAIMNLAKLGFTAKCESSLRVSEEEGKVIYTKCPPELSNTQRRLKVFTLTEADFRKRFGVVTEVI